MNKKILVLDGRSRATLSIIRSLGKSGFEIIVAESYKCFSFYSKYVSRNIVYPRPDKNPENFLSFLIDYLKENKIDVIIPVRDDTTEIVSKNAKALSAFTSFLVPTASQFDIARDKSETIKLARKLSIPHPKTVLTHEEPFEIEQLKELFDLPVLIKPRISSGSRGIKVIKNWNEFSEEYSKIHAEFPYPMIQEFIEHGGAYGVSFLFLNGIMKARFTHKRLREFPESGGPSTLRTGVSFPEIEIYSQNILSALNWNGVAMVEYRVDRNTGNPMLMEINPRFWGSLETAVFSGVDFPRLLVDASLSGNCIEIFSYPLNKKVRWLLFGDVFWFFSGRFSYSKLVEFVKFRHKDLSYDILSFEDLGPVYGIFLEAFKSVFNIKRLAHVFKRGW